jgi:alanine dehydrogenase
MEQKRKPSITASFSYLPLEETLEIVPKKEQLFIGIPREDNFPENRVPLTPSAVSVIVNNGHQVWIEHNAGEKSFYYDNDYSEAGAKICYSKEELYQANIIIKAAPITDNEIAFMQLKQIVIAPMHMPGLSIERVQQMQQKKIIAIDSGGIKDQAGYYPIVRGMSEIAGVFAINTAAQLLTNNADGKGILLGGLSGVPPCQVIILGAGTVGENAARTAIGLGAQVKIFDNNLYKLSRVQRNLGQHIYTSVMDPVLLADELMNTDVLIGALKPHKGETPIVVSEEMVANMKAGSVIIDVSIDCGGCVETSEVTTHENPTFKKYDVTHYCVPNIPSAVSRTASQCLSNIIMPMMLDAFKSGGFESLITNQLGFRSAVYIYNGFITNEHMGNKLNLKYTSIELLLTSLQ